MILPFKIPLSLYASSFNQVVSKAILKQDQQFKEGFFESICQEGMRESTMAVQGMLVLQLMLVVLALVSTAIAAPTIVALKELNCTQSCGNVSIPYPFGVEKNCYLDEPYRISCNMSKPYYGNMPILNISHEDAELRVMKFVARACYDQSGSPFINNSDPELTLSKFSISNTKNKFTAVGCDTVGTIQVSRNNDLAATGCISRCSNSSYVANGICSGIGCCQSSIPRGVGYNHISLASYKNHTDVWDFNSCSYAFVVEEGEFNFSTSYLRDFKQVRLPMVIDWAIGNMTCQNTKTSEANYACGDNSECYDRENGFGYICKCQNGYQGNPYLSDGCQEINECDDSNLNMCVHKNKCENKPLGNYTCRCPKGYHGDGRSDGEGCTANRFLIIQIVIGFFVGVTAILVCSSWLYWIFRKRKLIHLKEKFFRENGGLLLQQKLSREERSTQDVMKIFTSEELKQATNNYDKSRIVGRGGNGTVYKGILGENREVAVKKSNKIVDENQIEQFVNEVVVLSQINHRNVVRLLGCCLETQVPLLVYEFITNGTLCDHIHNESYGSAISWEIRLRIAAETAGVLSYLHSAASVPIIHRDVKTANILLDDNYTAKVSDFGASRLVPLDQDQLATVVLGTFGYLDPEYFHSGQLTEKSDVYSFGVVLAELITGKKAVSFHGSEEERCLTKFFLSALRNDRLFLVVDERIVVEGNAERLKEVANLARRCLKVKGEERPTMKQVAMELDRLIVKQIGKHPWAKTELNHEETQYLLGETPTAYEFGGNSNTIPGYDSIGAHIVVPILDGGR
ncbi:wall-associated receptor kinase 2-like isoform X2 [Actinidia eriantha]|uniref:wall-associated receptor kinase 2-like isoform X2 n=1 Tax=Actinidia eriantha TaxID=165200 RepID=UPI00258F509F|nr:wall-associated receptor kinase 2-like isoform X2 [Actinidia eriantha]